MNAARLPPSNEVLQYAPRLLVVDPIVQTAEIVSRHFQAVGFGCRVRGVVSERDLRAALHGFHPHVILAGRRSANGLDAGRVLEIARAVAPDTSVVVWADLPEQDLAAEILQLGAADFIPKNEPGRLVAAMYRALRDVAARRIRRLAEERIREGEQLLRDVVDASHDWIWELNGDARIVFCSESVQRILGYTPRQLLGEEFVERVHEDDRARVREALSALDSSSRLATGLVARWRSSSGRYRRLELHLLALIEPPDVVAGYRGTSRDVTERCEQEERIAQLTRMLRMVVETHPDHLDIRVVGQRAGDSASESS